VSRSGSTFAGALSLGFKRQDAARLSFLLGIPAISLAGLHELWILRSILTADGWLTLAVGLSVSSVSAFLAIWGLMRFLEHSSTWLLVVYRALFGAALMVASYHHWIQ
jgi:undecaprenyl-diphosphatase